MVFPYKQKVILFGDSDRVCAFLNSEIVGSLEIIGVYRDSLLDTEEIPSKIQNLSFDSVKSMNDCLIVIVDDEVSQNRADFFTENSITFILSKDIEIDYPPCDKEAPVGVADEEDLSDATLPEDVSAPTESEQEVSTENPPAEQAPPVLSDAQFNALMDKLTGRFDEILKAVSYTKAKDTSIYNINKELQSFKDGYFKKTVSPLVVELISLREDCKKSLESIGKYALAHPKQISYMEYTVEQIENVLTIQDVTVKDGIYFYNGVPFYPTAQNVGPLLPDLEPAACPSTAEAVETDPLTLTGNTLESLLEFVVRWQQRIDTLLAENSALTETILQQVQENKKQHKVTDGLLLKPIFIKLIQLSDFFEKRLSVLTATVDDEEAAEIYQNAYAFAVTYLEDLLLNLGVHIHSNIDNTFDPKYHRMLKMISIEPEEAEKDKTIASFNNDCYIADDKVIYPAKVVLYRLKNNK